MDKKGVGLASFGMSGQVFHGPLLRVSPYFEIRYILERSKNLSAELYPEARIVRSYHELLSQKDIDLVVVNTPDTIHYEMTKDALLAGKNVVVEKPFVKNSRHGEELIELAERNNLLLSVFQNRRWDGDFMTVRKIMEEGMLGRLVEFEAHYDRYRNFIQENTWKELEGSGSTLLNLGSHIIDQALVLFGKPQNVFADIRTMRTGGSVDDAFTLLMAYPEIKVTLKASYLVKEAGPRYYLHGTEGSFLKYGLDPQEDALKRGELPDEQDWGREERRKWGILNTETDGKTERTKYETLAGRYQEYYNDIARALRDGAKPLVTGDQGNLVIKIIETAFESHKNGRRMAL